ncbi:hypothetical protein C8F01DRAFT_1107159 [Mycena amicta]|nr:hypothetical protein C8F01DRAFT_1107159 [Mycena amicta]
MGLAPSKSRARPYPLVQPGFTVPHGQNADLYLPPQLQSRSNSDTKKKKKRRGSEQAELADAYVRGWHAGSKGMGPQPPIQPAAAAAGQSQNTQNLNPVVPVQPVAAQIADVLQPLPPASAAVYGPPQSGQPLPPLSNPLPSPPRDLYELSPYNTLLNLPQTTALLTSNYGQLGSLPPPNYDRRKGGRGGLLRTLTGRGRKEEELRFVPVFINAPNQAAGEQPVSVPPITSAAAPTPAVVPPTPGPEDVAGQHWHMPTPHPSHLPPPVPSIRFSGTSYEYAGFLNYSPHRVVYGGRDYPTAMHLHEAMKFLPDNLALSERIRLCPDVTQVYAISQDLVNQFGETAIRQDWAENYLSLMEEAVLYKFRQHANLRDMLLKTKPAHLIYADEQDPFWGEGAPGEGGLNNLGRLLEVVRERLDTEGGLQS